MLKKLKQAIQDGQSAVAEASGSPEAQTKPVVALLVLDPAGPDSEALRRQHLAATKSAGARALFILGPKSEFEHADLDLLCEYLPLPEDLARATGERADGIRRYILARLRLILDKWAVRDCRWSGETAFGLVEGLNTEQDASRRQIRFERAG